jgi:hypothetical protein
VASPQLAPAQGDTQIDSAAKQRHHDRGSAPQSSAKSWVLKVTETSRERAAAFHLVYQVYHRAGLMPADPQEMRVMKHHLSDQTDVLIAKRGGKVVLTSTLVRDAEYGLPLESLFASEVAAMRADGLRVAEISCLASDISLQDKSERFDLLVKIIGLTFQTARHRGIDRLLMAVHPKHARVYQRLFGCQRCSDVKQYAAVQDNPAVLCMHDFARCDVNRYPLYSQIYAIEHAPWRLVGTRMTSAEKWRLGQSLSTDAVPLGA